MHLPAVQDQTFHELTLEKQLALLNAFTQNEFDETKSVINARLRGATQSLQQSAAAIHMLLAAQSPADLLSPMGIALRADLESLLANSKHLERLATLLQRSDSSDPKVCENHHELEIANVVEAVEKHRIAVQDNAIALTEAALNRARWLRPNSRISRIA